MKTPAERAAWAVANAAVDAAFDVTIAATEIAFREKYPKVEALYDVGVDFGGGGGGGGIVCFDRVLVNGSIRTATQIKPENAESITAFLNEHIPTYSLDTAADRAIRRATTKDGLWRDLPPEVTS